MPAGYYGASNEALIMQSLVQNGPVAVSFEVGHVLFMSRRGQFRGKPRACQVTTRL